MYCSRLFCKFMCQNIPVDNNRCLTVFKSMLENQRSFHAMHINKTRNVLNYGYRFNKSTTNCQFMRRFMKKNSRGGGPFMVEFTGMGKPLVFTAVVCGCSFIGAMMYTRQRFRRRFSRQKNSQQNIYGRNFGYKDHFNRMWNTYPPGKKLVVGIIAANVLVFVCWRFRSLTPMLLNYFTSSPLKGHPVSSMLFSTFSHMNGFHLFFNMYMFWSLSSAVSFLFRPEELAAFYLSAGVISSLAGHAYALAFKSPMNALGASGALFALLGTIAVFHPEARFQIAIIGDIIPHSFTADSLCKAMIAFDLAGVLYKWRTGNEMLYVLSGGRFALGHACHLGGILFGILYAKYGRKLYEKIARKK